MPNADEGNTYRARRVRRPTDEERRQLQESTSAQPRSDDWMSRVSKRITGEPETEPREEAETD